MSRYQWIENKKEVSIGWDVPMNTYFVQIHNPDAVLDKDYCELWLGTNFDEFTHLESLKTKLPFQIDENLEIHLLSDQYGVLDADGIAPLPEHITKRF